MEKDNEALDEIYEAGYRRLPEDSELGEAQMALLDQVLPKEDWGDSGLERPAS